MLLEQTFGVLRQTGLLILLRISLAPVELTSNRFRATYEMCGVTTLGDTKDMQMMLHKVQQNSWYAWTITSMMHTNCRCVTIKSSERTMQLPMVIRALTREALSTA